MSESWERGGSDAVLQSSDGEGLDDLPRWLRLDDHDLAEDLPLSGLRGGLHARLDTAKARKREDPVLLHLGGSDLSDARKKLRHHRLLQLALACHRVGEGALAHCRGLLHGRHSEPFETGEEG